MINQRRVQLTNRLQKSLRQKTHRKRFVRYGLIAANVLVLGAVVGFVITSSHRDRLAASGTLADNADVSNPVDGLTSYDIAANIAHLASLPESNAIDNQAQSAHAVVAVSTSDVNIVAKPQLVATAIKTRADIQSYVVQAGDTVTAIAQKLGVTTDSVKWSNNLTTDKVAVGTKLAIPPQGMNGIVYTVKDGDTVQTLATKFKADADKIANFNDAEKSGLSTGEQIVIPGGQVLAPVSLYAGLRGGSFVAQYGSNGYDYGYCTYYAAYRSGAPSNWGNANTWAYYAALSGWTVSSTPRAGAIAQTSAGYLGHVAIVEDVSDDGTQIKFSDMNGISGWGRVGFSDWVPASRFQHYIYR
jgi:surface antigen